MINSVHCSPTTSSARAIEQSRASGTAESGERALEGGAVGRPAMRWEHELDRQLEQRAQPLGDLLARHARAEPPLVDLIAVRLARAKAR
jgi:hypothetical protein